MNKLHDLKQEIERLRDELHQIVSVTGNFKDDTVARLSAELDMKIVAYERTKQCLSVRGDYDAGFNRRACISNKPAAD